MHTLTRFLVILSVCMLIGCKRRERAQSNNGKTPVVRALPAVEPESDGSGSSPSVVAPEKAETMAKPVAASVADQREPESVAEPVAPEIGVVPRDWAIESASREVQPGGRTIYTGEVRTETPNGHVIQSDRAELVVNEEGIPVSAIYEGRVRMQSPEGLIETPLAEIVYNAEGRAISLKFQQVEFTGPKK